ncbi:hypothetical protein LIS04_10 [Listeria phage LIS04]|nr:hypothetical protein LIS04_10 [Listeria phage LIS04]
MSKLSLIDTKELLASCFDLSPTQSQKLLDDILRVASEPEDSE